MMMMTTMKKKIGGSDAAGPFVLLLIHIQQNIKILFLKNVEDFLFCIRIIMVDDAVGIIECKVLL